MMDVSDRYMIDMVIFGRVMADALNAGQPPKDAEKIATNAIKAIDPILGSVKEGDEESGQKAISRLYFLASLYGQFAGAGIEHKDAVEFCLAAADKFHKLAPKIQKEEPAAERDVASPAAEKDVTPPAEPKS